VTGLAAVLGLTALRLLLGPLLVWMALRGIAGAPAVALCLAALASDYFDGVLARRHKVDTPALRRFDSATDTVFFLSAAWAAWLLHADLLRPWLWLALAVVVLEIARYAFDLAKFRREAAYHAWSAKVWGLSLFAALVALFGFGSAVPLVPLALGLGIVADSEGLAISVVLPVWAHDVKSIVHARRIRVAHRSQTVREGRRSGAV
jgi:CDP-diacylglycerol--glycerol-3-phosphate 3-phosphatidyltransferase